jgi:hypothetical protein
MTGDRARKSVVLDHVFTLPAEIPAGRCLVHNSVRPSHHFGVRRFPAWLADPAEDHLERCGCGWAPKLGAHYRIGGAQETDR